jgi:hypothetical protein
MVVCGDAMVLVGAAVVSAITAPLPSPLVSAVEQPTNATTPKMTAHPMRAVRRSSGAIDSDISRLGSSEIVNSSDLQTV